MWRGICTVIDQCRALAKIWIPDFHTPGQYNFKEGNTCWSFHAQLQPKPKLSDDIKIWKWKQSDSNSSLIENILILEALQWIGAFLMVSRTQPQWFLQNVTKLKQIGPYIHGTEANMRINLVILIVTETLKFWRLS